MITYQLCNFFYYHSQFATPIEATKVKRFDELKELGYDVRVEYQGISHLWRKYVVNFNTEEELALFKLTHL